MLIIGITLIKIIKNIYIQKIISIIHFYPIILFI